MSAAKLELTDGRPRLTIDGVVYPPLIYSTSFLKEKQLEIFASLGVDLVSFSTTADFHLYGLAKTAWPAPDQRDFSELDERLDLIARAHPRAKVLPRVLLCSPPWWDALYPDDLVLWDDGKTTRPLLHGAFKSQVPSLSSERWRRAMCESVRALIDHVAHSPHADRVIGYMINSGNSEEWFHWGVMERYLFDYNPQTTVRFRDWLRVRYADDSAALSSAWATTVDFETAAIPAPDRRRADRGEGFRDPKRDRDIIDFGLFFADLTADTISMLARVVKEATAGEKLFGTFYGYVLELTHHPEGVQNSGHIGLHRVLADPNVDFLASPSSYARRMPGDGYSMSMVPSASFRIAQKVFFHENDIRTHVLFDDAGYGRTDSGCEGAAIQRRELAHALCHGHGMWWFDMTSGWYDDPQLKRTITDAVAIMKAAAKFETKSVAEIALVIDEESLLSVHMPEARLVQLVVQQCLELSRVGAPFDVFLLRDLEHAGPMKLWIFPVLFSGDAKTRERIHDRLARDRATGVFVYAPGMIDDTIDIAHASRMCGIPLAYPTAPRFQTARAKIGADDITYGTRFWWGRAPIVADAAAEVIAWSSDEGLPIAAKKSHGSYHTVFSAVPALPGRLLRRLARESGVSLYLDTDDAVYASSTFLAVHARSGGRKRIHCLGTEVLYDVTADVEIRGDKGSFVVYLPKAETWIAFRGSAARFHASPATELKSRD